MILLKMRLRNYPQLTQKRSSVMTGTMECKKFLCKYHIYYRKKVFAVDTLIVNNLSNHLNNHGLNVNNHGWVKLAMYSISSVKEI